ncbi:S9 family peptidase [soil metagenome]
MRRTLIASSVVTTACVAMMLCAGRSAAWTPMAAPKGAAPLNMPGVHTAAPAIEKAGEGALTPRADIFAPARFADARLSPNGKFVAYLAPVAGVMNVWVEPIGTPQDARPLSSDAFKGIREFQWSPTGDAVLFMTDPDGDGTWLLYRAEVTTNKVTNLTPMEPIVEITPVLDINGEGLRKRTGVLRVLASSPKSGQTVIAAWNGRDERAMDVYKLNLLTGELTGLYENDGFESLLFDDDLTLRIGVRPANASGAIEVLKATIIGSEGKAINTKDDAPGPAGAKGNGGSGPDAPSVDVEQAVTWEPLLTIAAADVGRTRILGLVNGGTKLLMLDARGRSVAAPTTVEIATGSVSVLAEPGYAFSSALVGGSEHRVLGLDFDAPERSWKSVDAGVDLRINGLAKRFPRGFEVTAQDADGSKWLVETQGRTRPPQTWLVRSEGDPELLFSNTAVPNTRGIETTQHGAALPLPVGAAGGAHQEIATFSVTQAARDAGDEKKDGLRDGGASVPTPTVILLRSEGGTTSRDFDAEAFWLAERGYCVYALDVDGVPVATGGSRLEAILQAVTAMHDSLRGADGRAQKAAILGAGLGGWAALNLAAQRPESFNCVAVLDAPTDLLALVDAIPAAQRAVLAGSMGDVVSVEGRARVAGMSPVNALEKLSMPLLLVSSRSLPTAAFDLARVRETLGARGVKVITVDLSQDPASADSAKLGTYAIAENFLAKHAGGKAEALGEFGRGECLTVTGGAEFLKGLEAARPLVVMPPEK